MNKEMSETKKKIIERINNLSNEEKEILRPIVKRWVDGEFIPKSEVSRLSKEAYEIFVTIELSPIFEHREERKIID